MMSAASLASATPPIASIPGAPPIGDGGAPDAAAPASPFAALTAAITAKLGAVVPAAASMPVAIPAGEGDPPGDAEAAPATDDKTAGDDAPADPAAMLLAIVTPGASRVVVPLAAPVAPPIAADSSEPSPQAAGDTTGGADAKVAAAAVPNIPAAPARPVDPQAALDPALDIDALFPNIGDTPLAVAFGKALKGLGKESTTAATATAPANGAPATPVDSALAAIAAAVEKSAPAKDVAAPDAATRITADSAAGVVAAPSAPATAPPPLLADRGAAVVSAAVNHSETTIQHHLDVAHDGAWLDRLARDIATTADKDARLRFQLNPEHLGSLHVELANGSDGTSIRLTTDTEAARSLIADSQQRLVAEARAQGMRIAETRIDLGGQGAGGQRQPSQDQAAMIRTTATAAQQQPVAQTAAETRPSRERYA